MDKELLLKDLCARLPYDVICNFYYVNEGFNDGNLKLGPIGILHIKEGNWEVKPYLRPLSSMTEEEREYLRNIDDFLQIDVTDNTVCGGYKTFDYLNSIHVDYRDLIDKGLALPAPEGMYNSNEK